MLIQRNKAVHFIRARQLQVQQNRRTRCAFQKCLRRVQRADDGNNEWRLLIRQLCAHRCRGRTARLHQQNL